VARLPLHAQRPCSRPCVSQTVLATVQLHAATGAARASCGPRADRWAAGDGGEAHVGSRGGLAGTTGPGPSAQRHPVRVRRLKVLVRVDLPVDVVVVLEQKERAGQAQGTECTLGKRGCSR
jgi:hypothetical protein